jgi:hypothetical protein
MPAEGGEHMVKIAHPGFDIGLAGTVQIDAEKDVRFGRLAAQFS